MSKYYQYYNNTVEEFFGKEWDLNIEQYKAMHLSIIAKALVDIAETLKKDKNNG